MRTVDPERWYTKVRKATTHRRRAPNNFETRARSSFCDAMHEFWLHCSIGGVNRISNRSFPKFVRCSHAAVFLLAFCMALVRLGYTVHQLRAAPRVLVTERSSQETSQRILFPAVALCSTNVISKEPLMRYTMLLDSMDQNHTYNSRSIRENLLQFGSLLTMNLPAVDVTFMQLLSHADPTLNVSQLMYQFSSPCSEMLRRCSWRGKIVPCESLFATRATPLGYCCVFNSRYYPEDIHRPAKYLDMVGQDYGLSVVVRENPDDFVFVRRASTGLDVLLFDGSEYPILEGGGVRMYPVEWNASVFLSVSTRTQLPAPGARGRCPAAAPRSCAWCLVRCRWRTLAALCSCRFYTVPPQYADENPVCSLTHLACLNKHKEKLIYYYPSGYTASALDEELQNSQECSHCAPDCWRRVYSAAAAGAHYSNKMPHKNFRNVFTKDESLVNSTVIRLFFPSENHKVYVIEANKMWFEIFATISGAWCGTVGAPLAALSELAFHLSVRWMRHYRRRARRSCGTLG